MSNDNIRSNEINLLLKRDTTMALHDEIRQEQKKVKDMSLKGKIKYFWDYYKIHTIVGILVIIGIVVFVRDYVKNNRPMYLDAIMVNTILDYNDPKGIDDDFAEYANVDRETYNLSIETGVSINMEFNDEMTMATVQKIMALFQAKSLDLLIAPEDIIDYYASNDPYANIHQFLTDDQIKLLEDNGYPIYYGADEGVVTPAGFYIGKSEYLKNKSEFGTFMEDANPVFAFAFCNNNPEASVQFLSMLTGLDL